MERLVSFPMIELEQQFMEGIIMLKKNIIKRFCAVVLSLALCFSLSGTAFAAEPAEFAMNEETEQQEASCSVLSDDGIMPLSSIGGYAKVVFRF